MKPSVIFSFILFLNNNLYKSDDGEVMLKGI
jgi:hypothetical protein